MPQTLLGLLGILLASFLSLHQLRSSMDADVKTREAEVQALLADVALSRLGELEALPFDEAVKEAYAASVVELTPVVGAGFFRIGGDAANDDLDDAHGTSTTTTHTLRDGQASFRAVAAVTVGYVSEADGTTPSAVPTRFKRATVTVTSPDVGAPSVSLSQLYSCGSYCTW